MPTNYQPNHNSYSSDGCDDEESVGDEDDVVDKDVGNEVELTEGCPVLSKRL